MYGNVWYKRWKHQMYNSSHTLAVHTLLTFPIEKYLLKIPHTFNFATVSPTLSWGGGGGGGGEVSPSGPPRV